MLRAAKYVAVVIAILAIAVVSKAGLPAIATGSWEPAGQMSVARTGAASVLLPDGRIMIIGGADANGNPQASTEFFDTNGNFVAGPPMNVARTGHSAIWLANGEVLVTGGTTSATGVTPPAVTNSAEIFDPLFPDKGWQQISPMPNARKGHTATMLQDGSVLLAGGENSAGTVSALDIFAIAPTDHFVSAGTLNTPRKAHGAAALKDGRVLIVGGTDSNGATLASSEIYDPANGTVSAGPSLSTPRTGATATALLDGTVLIAGGAYPEGVAQGVAPELQSAEIYDPSTGMRAAPNAMSAARQGHLAVLLPNNNNVLLVGGSTTDPATGNSIRLSSVEYYTPWKGQFTAATSMASARANATGIGLTSVTYPVSGTDGVLLVAGGSDQPTAEMYGFATVKTDKDVRRHSSK